MTQKKLSEPFRMEQFFCFFFEVPHSHLETNDVPPLRKRLKIFNKLLIGAEDLGVSKDQNSSDVVP